MLAFVVAATAICVGGAVAVVALERGAPTPVALLLMAMIVVGGVLGAGRLIYRAWPADPGEAGSTDSAGNDAPDTDRTDVDAVLPKIRSRGIRRAERAHRRAVRRLSTMDPTVLLEQRLSLRYGVPVKRVAAHVWRINGELVEATWDAARGQLVVGGRELRL